MRNMVTTDIDWKAIKEEMRFAPYVPDDEGTLFRTIFLGTVFDIMPSGKYWTCFACSNMTEDEMTKDEEYYDALESEAEKHGYFIIEGEGDPCDMLIAEALRCPRCNSGVRKAKFDDPDILDDIRICANPDCDWYDTVDGPPVLHSDIDPDVVCPKCGAANKYKMANERNDHLVCTDCGTEWED